MSEPKWLSEMRRAFADAIVCTDLAMAVREEAIRVLLAYVDEVRGRLAFRVAHGRCTCSSAAVIDCPYCIDKALLERETPPEMK